ncbi:MAG: serine O-acetyltransferase [Magnetococcus sp. DMHC-6]
MFERLKNELLSIMDRDPAAGSMLEVLTCYPGVYAILIHRLAHRLWNRNFRISARLLSNMARLISGIEIHPGAQIGKGFFIDHGMGVVIGETTQIGHNVTLYHGVTLGGTSWNTGKRHPTLEDNVVIGAGATILGPITIGKNARVGSNAVVVKDVPADATAIGIPARLVMGRAQENGVDTKFHPYGHNITNFDPVAKAITCLLEQVHQMDRRIQMLENQKEKRNGQEVSHETLQNENSSNIQINTTLLSEAVLRTSHNVGNTPCN